MMIIIGSSFIKLTSLAICRTGRDDRYMLLASLPVRLATFSHAVVCGYVAKQKMWQRLLAKKKRFWNEKWQQQQQTQMCPARSPMCILQRLAPCSLSQLVVYALPCAYAIVPR